MAFTKSINRTCSPMLRTEEDLRETHEENIERVNKMERLKKLNLVSFSDKCAFLIGSIEEVNRKISNLDQKLQSYSDLIVESQSSDHTDGPFKIEIEQATSSIPEAYRLREKEAKEVNQFAGFYAIKSTFLSKPSRRMRNITKISMIPSKTPVVKDTGKPKFVELHQFHGYDPKELTPLPNNTTTIAILRKVAKAQSKLKNMPHYKPEFEKVFFSEMSQAVLQDTFWWLFLDRWQPSRGAQQNLFNRVSHNYVKLMTYCKNPRYRDTFLRSYPDLLSQAVYATFCASFPDSYKQFEEDFKEAIIACVFEWIAGIRPAPRLHLQWSTSEIEPDGFKDREDLINQGKSSNKCLSYQNLKIANSYLLSIASIVDLNFLDSQLLTSQSTLNRYGSISSLSSAGHQSNKRPGKLTSKSIASSPSTDGSVFEGQRKSPTDGKRLKLEHSRDRLTERNRTMSPIHEFEESPKKSGKPPSKGQSSFRVSPSHARESLPVGRGPEFVKTAFNTFGQSPLVAHFLNQRNLQTEAGLHLRVQRTELIQESYKKIREFKKNYKNLDEQGNKESVHFVCAQKAALREFLSKEEALMAKPQEVKRLSDLILLELKKDKDSLNAGAAAAIEKAFANIL
ncbi:hypothetical protein CAPTEDRAFT_211485 [Capitella teleta]|uniref:Protein FAM227B n=1 Tax=Capitella teleta TaxID=283909 RepID=R7UAS7_CAPTE|nr:hypothetical protein CAPTEDRAFT_211485 [Capitella teleta]|eukprot:ELU03430.1 hypothetical protein CAPTEDRAFT_211485 [Capitella teleta]